MATDLKCFARLRGFVERSKLLGGKLDHEQLKGENWI